jgi:hypothetical protein
MPARGTGVHIFDVRNQFVSYYADYTCGLP